MEKNLQEELDEIIERKDYKEDEKKFLKDFSKYILKHGRLTLFTSQSDMNMAVYGSYVTHKGIEVIPQEDGSKKLTLFVHRDYGEVSPDEYYNPTTISEYEETYGRSKEYENNEVSNESILDLALANRKSIEKKLEREENER